DPTAVVVTMPLPADLDATGVNIPPSGVAGPRTTSISWTVTNVGTNPAVGSWIDSLYLSIDETWSVDDPLLDRFYHAGDVAPGDSYTAQGLIALPGVPPGSYRVIVRTDVLHNLRQADRSNDQVVSPGTIAVEIPALPLNQTITPTLLNGGDL